MREPGAGLSSAVAEALSVTGGLLPGAAEADIPFFAYANASSSVWLLPTDAADRRAALSLYAPQKLRGRALRGAMRRGILSRRTTLDADRVTDLREEIERALATRVRALAFYIGPPNLSRKCTICVIGPERTPIAFAKLAALPQARSMIRNERAVLRQLSEVPGLLDRIPAVLGTITWSDSEAILLAPGPTRAAPSRFGELHEEFLLRLHEASERTGDLLVSPAWMEAERTQDRLVPLLPPAWIDRYARAFEQVRARLGGVSMRLVRAHRDFAPWNMRVGRRGLFVFDWESSREGLPGLFDVFQYSTVPAALMNRPAVRPWASRHRRREGDPVGSPDPEELWLPFLVDLSLEYAAAAAEYPYRGKERVREWFGREIDRALADP